MTVEISEGERQVVLLAIAELALSRPGWDAMLTETANAFGGIRAVDEFAEFKRVNVDRVMAERGPLGPR